MSANYREPQFLLPNCKNLKLPGTGTSVGSGLTEDRHSLYSMDFDGSSYIDTGFSLDNSYNALTLSGWVKYTSISNFTGTIFGGWTNNTLTGSTIIVYTVNNKIQVYYNNSGSLGSLTSTTTLSTGTWFNIALRFDGSTLKLYINGNEEASSSLSAINNLFGNLILGAFLNATQTGYQGFLNGELDEVAIFSRALSSSEITTLYNSGSPSNPMLLSGKPIAYYPLGEQARKPGTAEWRFPNEVLQGQAINFDGNDDFISISTNTLGITTAICISSWIKTSSTSGAKTIFCQSNRATRANFYLGQKHNYVQFGIYHPSGTTFINTQAYGIVSDNKWHNIVGTWDGTTNANSMKIYIDGNIAAQGTPLYTGIKNTTDRANFPRIGATYDNAEFFDGELSNIVVWDTDQSANITNIYNYGAPQTSYTVTPTAWYKLDKTSTFTGLNPNWHSALNLDGNNDYIDFGADSTLEITGNFTISTWVNLETMSGYRRIIGKANSNNTRANYGLGFFGGNRPGVIANATGSWFTNYSANPLSTGVWHHLVGVYDGSNFILYVNGSLDNSTSVSGFNIATAASATSGDSLLIGQIPSGIENFKGSISNTAIFKQAISAEDVKYLYNGGTPQTNISFEPTSWYKLDNTGTGIQDSGSASNNGTNNGATAVSSSVAVDEWVFENAVQSQTPNWSSALSFDGYASSDAITLGNTIGNGFTQITCSIWVKLSTAELANTSYYRNFLVKFSSGPGPAPFELRGNHSRGDSYDNKLFFRVNTDTGSYGFTDAGFALSEANRWYHIVGTYDGSNVKTFVDGVEKTSISANGTLISNSNNATIGFSTGTGGFDGEMSNAAIFNTALDLNAIKALYNNGQPEATISSSPVSWWKLDNTTTGIQDSIGSNNGTNNGATEIQTNVWTPRLNGESDTLPSTALVSSDLQFNSAYSSFSLNFDSASSDYVEINNPGNIIGYGENAFTFSGWINADSFSDQDGIFCRRQDTNNRIAIKLSLTSPFNGIMLQAANASVSGYSSWDNILNANRWYHICAIYDGTQSNNADRFKLWVDGVYQGARTSAGGTIPATLPNITSTNPIDISIDKQVGAPTRCFDGKIDEVSVFNKVLNQAEITSIYNNGYPKDITALSPISWWRLGEDAYFNGNDFIVPNQITGAPNGTSNGMPATALVADAPGSYAAGLGSSLALADRLGDAPLSTANSLSFNMTPENRISYPAGYVPTQANNIYSMAFDGTNDYVNAGTSLFTGAIINPISISCWIKTTVGSAWYGAIISKDLATNGNRNFLFQIASNNVYWQHSTNGNGLSSLIVNQSTYNVIDGNWHHIVVTYEAGSTSGTAEKKIYIDGELKATDPAATLNNIVNTTSVPIEIGRRGDSARYFDGNIDEVAIFDYALSARQVKQDIYNATASGKTADLNNNSNLTPPIAWYRMGD